MAVRFFDHLPAVEARLRGTDLWLVGLDFDGTLAPIVDHHDDARLEPRLRPLLEALSARGHVPTVIMSGRGREDVEARIGLPDLIYAGNHGLDIYGPGIRFVEPSAAAATPVLDAMAQSMSGKLQGIPGSVVEHKGLTLSVHYRMVDGDSHEEVRRHVHGVLAGTDHPFALTTGKCVFEIRPRTYWNKGAAMTWIRDQLCPGARILYLGDDRTDEDAFRICADGVAVRVGDSQETAAGFYLDSQTDVFDFLNWVTSRI